MIRCVYEIRCPWDEVSQAARSIAVEQTVEVPEALITPDVEDQFVGRVVDVQRGEDAHRAVIDYPDETAGGHITQLLNLVLGNTSIDRRVRLANLELPESFLSRFRGPRYGIEGLRDVLGVYGRPLVCSALKPRGLTDGALAAFAGEFARGGGDIMKDDHNLVTDSSRDFQSRVRAVQETVLATNAETGGRTLYFPYVSAPVEELPRQIEFALELGVRGFLVAPCTLGLDFVRSMTDQYDAFFMGHPTTSGVFYAHPEHGFGMSVFMGALMRLVGLDASIVTQFGGRFNLPREECMETARRLREPFGHLKPAWPTPAGGLRLDMLDEAFECYGPDTILLIGGDLLTRPEGLQGATRALIERIRHAFPDGR